MNNNIVLIDTFVRLKNTGMDGIEAVVRTGAQRLRSVLLTAVTTVFGLLPMVLSMNIDFLAPEIAFRRAVDAMVGTVIHRSGERSYLCDRAYVDCDSLAVVVAGPRPERPRCQASTRGNEAVGSARRRTCGVARRRGSSRVAKVVIVGAGPAGAATALLLTRNGIGVELVERSDDFARVFRGEGMMPTGLAALHAMGLGDEVNALDWRPTERWDLHLNRQFVMSVAEPSASAGDLGLRAIRQSALLELIMTARIAIPTFSFATPPLFAMSCARMIAYA